jgi:hypothetical protein
VGWLDRPDDELVLTDDVYGVPLVQAYRLPLPEQQPRSSTTLALAASLVVCAGACRLYGFSGDNSKAAQQFIQVFDAEKLPADGAVPVVVIRVAAATGFSAYWGSSGRWFDRGVVLCNSSTEATKTIGSADCWFDAQYTPQVI